MKFNSRFSAGFYSGGATSTLVPHLYEASINGRGYMLDTERDVLRNGFREQSVPLLRQQADNSAVPSEASINPEDLWRRSQESWHLGAGQTNLDRPESSPFRFRTSKGVDVWTRFQLSLLPDTLSVRSSTNTNLALLPVGSYIYVADGNDLYFSSDLTATPPVWTASNIQNGEGAQPVKSIASDGKTVYAALGSNGIHSTSRGAGTSAHYSDLAATLVAYVKGRLMAAQGASIFNVIASGAAPSALLTQPNSDFTWVGFAAGPAAIYAAGYSGDKSLIYRTAVKADGTALDVPVVAGELPDGEIVRAICGYLGYLLVGTDKGVRVAQLDSSGNISNMGRIIPTTSAVGCFEPQDRFVWYGQTNYDSTSTGLGRLDLSQFTDTLTPAYTSDLMVTAQGAVLSVASFADARVLAVSGLGVYTEATTPVASGTLDEGIVNFGLSDPKVSMTIDVRHAGDAGTHKAYLSVDGGAFALCGIHATGDPDAKFPTGQKSGETFEVRLELDSVSSVGPTLTRSTLTGEPRPSRTVEWTLPLLISEKVRTLDEQERFFDVAAAYEEIRSLVTRRTLIPLQVGTNSVSAFVADYDFMRQKPTQDGKAWQGVMTVLCKEPAS